MKRGWGRWIAWLIMAAILVFFENNTGTKALFLWSLVIPFLLMRIGPSRRKPPRAQAAADRPVREPRDLETASTEPDALRAYVPGDPVRRIHWKLSAKTDRLLIREDGRDTDPVATETTERVPSEEPEGDAREKRLRRRAAWGLLALLALCLALLAALPSARNGVALLLNRLFDRSEAVNAYRYVRLPTDGASEAAAIVLLSLSCLACAGFAGLRRSRGMALVAAAALCAGQAYFGLSLPLWVNLPVLGALALCLLPEPPDARKLLACAGSLLVAALLVSLLWPGADSGIERASEQARDWLSRAAGQTAGETEPLPESMAETRHVHTESLLCGDREAHTGDTYRLVTLEEQQIARPRWIDWLRVLLMSLLAMALLVLPFAPFVWLNRRRRKAAEARRVFDAEDVPTAVCAMFRHVNAELEATGHGCGNLLYRAWPEAMTGLPEDYVSAYARCVPLFEEAAYSDHAMTEEQREQARSLLERTEAMLLRASDWRQRLRMRYGECLWIG